MRDFRRLKVWQKGLDLAKHSFTYVIKLKEVNHYNLADQIGRSATSIPSNIAEGSGRRSNKEYYRFLEIALGSSFELETQLLIAESLLKEDILDLIERNVEIQKMTSGLMRTLNLKLTA